MAGILTLRIGRTQEDKAPREEEPTAALAYLPASETEETPEPLQPEAEVAQTPEPLPVTPIVNTAGAYTAETYDIVSEMIFIRRNEIADGDALIRDLEKRLNEADPVLGEVWTGIMDYWQYANEEMPINSSLPDGLPQDDSLCLVVLGYQLLYDGDMAPELIGRCEVALQAALQYPNAILAVTGGGTAGGDKNVTEAGVMADWFIARGIAPERIVIEDRSLTTDQNAVNTCEILLRDQPQVRQVAVISSDYHLPLGCTMFTEASLLCALRLGAPPYTVVSNAAWQTNGSTPGYSGMKRQASYVWIMADPHF